MVADFEGDEEWEDDALPSAAAPRYSREETLTFFDYDDTLFPTTWIESKPLFKDWWSGRADAKDVLSEVEWAEMRASDHAAFSIVVEASQCGKVCCVTLAQPIWLQRTMESFMPVLADAWKRLA